MSAFRTYEDQQRAIAAASLEVKKRACIAEVYRTHQDIVPCMANDGHIIGVIERFYGTEVVPTASLFQDVIAENPETIKSFVRRPVRRQQENLIDEIVAALQSTNDPTWKSSINVRSERTRMSVWTVENLRARLAQILEAQRLQKLSSDQIRQELQASRPQQPVRVTLPAEYTAERLRDRNFPVSELKKLIRTFGADACNDRLSGKA